MKSKSKAPPPQTLNYSSHNPLWKATLWKKQNWKLWRQKCCTWRNVHKSLLLPGNTVWFILWLDDVLFLLLGNSVGFSPHAASKPLTVTSFRPLKLICPHFYCGGGGGGCRAASQQDHCWKTTVCIVVLVLCLSLPVHPSLPPGLVFGVAVWPHSEGNTFSFFFLKSVTNRRMIWTFRFRSPSDGGFTLRKLDGANYSLSTWRHSPRRSTDETDECGLLLFLSTDVISTFIPLVQNYNWTVTPPQFLRILLVLLFSSFSAIFF